MAKRGRPRTEIHAETFEKLCGLQCTLSEIASWFKCSEDTIERWCKKQYQTTFAETFKRYSANGKISLRRYQFKMAEKSVPMAIFLGKNWLGQTDRIEQNVREVEDLTPLAELLADGKDDED
jgi:AraC-like DNA-binding protein